MEYIPLGSRETEISSPGFSVGCGMEYEEVILLGVVSEGKDD